MPSVQWGATNNAHLAFTPLGSALGALSNGAGTIAILWKPVSGGTRCEGVELANAGISSVYAGLGLGNGGTGKWADDNGTAWVASSTSPAFGDWYISVIDWPATAAKARFHWKDLTTAGAWTHEDSVTNGLAAFAGPGATGQWIIGYYSSNLGSGAQIALVGAWNVQLGDTNAALLSANSRTSDWASNPAGAPVFLSEITSLTPSDLIGASTFSAGSSLTTSLTVGGAPAGGWTFDGLGSSGISTPAGAVTFGARRADSSTRRDAPAGALTLTGQLVDAWVTRTHRDTPTGKLVLGGRAVERRFPPIVHADAPAGVLSIAGSLAEKAPSVVGLARGLGLQQTATLGTPGVIQPGYFYTGTAIWHGPFATEITLGITARARLVAGQQLTVAPSTASQFAAADAAWWEFH